MNQEKSNTQYDETIESCRKEFIEKNQKYGNSLYVYNENDVLSKIFIKIYRILSIQEAGSYKVPGESIEKELPGIINYCLYGIALASQLILTSKDTEIKDLLVAYNKSVQVVRNLFQKKNHDYGEAWRRLSVSFMIKECFVKYERTTENYANLKFDKDKQSELKKDFIEVFSDICNYAIFCSIRISEGTDPMI